MQDLAGLFVKSIFIDNIILVYFIGMCSFLACSKRKETARDLGLSVFLIIFLVTPINWFIDKYLLSQGALSWLGPFNNVDLSFLRFILFIAVIAAFVQILEMILDRFNRKLYTHLGVFLPLLTVNCAVLGVSLFVVERGYGFYQTCVFALGSGLGWALAINILAAIRKQLRYADVPYCLQDLGIAMIVTGLIAMTFMGFAGIRF